MARRTKLSFEKVRVEEGSHGEHPITVGHKRTGLVANATYDFAGNIASYQIASVTDWDRYLVEVANLESVPHFIETFRRALAHEGGSS